MYFCSNTISTSSDTSKYLPVSLTVMFSEISETGNSFQEERWILLT